MEEKGGKGTGKEGRGQGKREGKSQNKKEGDILALPSTPWPLTSLPLPPWLFPYISSSFPSIFGSSFPSLVPPFPLRTISSLPFPYRSVQICLWLLYLI